MIHTVSKAKDGLPPTDKKMSSCQAPVTLGAVNRVGRVQRGVGGQPDGLSPKQSVLILVGDQPLHMQ